MSSRGGNLIIIPHGLWRKAPFFSQSTLSRDFHHDPIMAVYTLPIEEKVKVSLQPICTCLDGGELQISWEESSSSCDRTPPDWSSKEWGTPNLRRTRFPLKDWGRGFGRKTSLDCIFGREHKHQNFLIRGLGTGCLFKKPSPNRFWWTIGLTWRINHWRIECTTSYIEIPTHALLTHWSRPLMQGFFLRNGAVRLKGGNWHLEQRCKGEWRYFRVVLWITTTMSFVRESWRLLRGGKYLHEEAMKLDWIWCMNKKIFETFNARKRPMHPIKKGKLVLLFIFDSQILIAWMFKKSSHLIYLISCW